LQNLGRENSFHQFSVLSAKRFQCPSKTNQSTARVAAPQFSASLAFKNGVSDRTTALIASATGFNFYLASKIGKSRKYTTAPS
jgi:hypothetical protein